VEQWAEVRRLRFVRGLSIREIHRRTGLHRDTIRRALSSDEPPVYRRAAAGSKLDPFKDEIHRLLRLDPRLPGQRIRGLVRCGLIVETRKRGDLEPGLAGGERALLLGFHRGSRAGGRVSRVAPSRCDGRTRADANSRRAPALRAR
jgi:hypothetical protein